MLNLCFSHEIHEQIKVVRETAMAIMAASEVPALVSALILFDA